MTMTKRQRMTKSPLSVLSLVAWCWTLNFCCCGCPSTAAATATAPTPAFINDLTRKLRDDFGALTRRVTARHILLPSEEPAIVLKQKIRDECISRQRYIIDVFEEAAIKYSRDVTTNQRGGLLGELVPQGYCRSPQLDRSCFEVPLGQMTVTRSEFGWHLLLVSERTNCPKLDGTQTKLVQTRGDDVFGTLVSSKQVGSVNVADIIMQQIGFWAGCFIAGGIVAELATRLVQF